MKEWWVRCPAPAGLGYYERVNAGNRDTEFRHLIDDYRSRCLWFLREDYYPETPADRARVLDLIERHGDLAVLARVAELRTWLSPSSSETSVAS